MLFFDIDVCVSVLYITSICVHASFYCTGLVGFDVCVLKFSTDVSCFLAVAVAFVSKCIKIYSITFKYIQ